MGFVLFDAGVPEKIPGAFFVSVAPCGHTAIVLCSAEHKTIAVCPHGATLTKKAPGIFSGTPASKSTNPINNSIIGEIINFKIEIVAVILFRTLLL
mgnify:CR=1 FL=1